MYRRDYIYLSEKLTENNPPFKRPPYNILGLIIFFKYRMYALAIDFTWSGDFKILINGSVVNENKVRINLEGVPKCFAQ